jgi:hypothetical protein
MKKLLFAVLFVVFFFLISSSQVSAAGKIYYVAGDVGLDTYTSAEATNSATPWKTIQKAADTMVAGDTVNVKGNLTYTGSNSCGFGNAVVCVTKSGASGNYITFQSWANTGTPTINATGQDFGFFSAMGKFITISGFEIKNVSTGSLSSGIGMFNTDHINILNNFIHGIGGVVGAGIYGNFVSYINIYNNTIYGNAGNGIHFDSLNPTNTIIKNNIITNNLVYGFGSMWVGTGSVVNYNNVWGNLLGDGPLYLHGANDISLNPLFVDPANGDFSLQPTSPAINMGADLTASGVTTDILGHARPKAGAYDIGAYEDTNYYVAGDTGNNSNVGSSVSPWLTIQKAADTMVAGDTVNVKGNLTYTESVSVANAGSVGNYITYQAWSGTGSPIITGGGANGFVSVLGPGKSYLVISGFTFQTASIYFSPGLGANSNITIKNNIFNNGQFYLQLNPNSINMKVINNTFYRTMYGLNFQYAGAVGARSVEIKNNIIVGQNNDDYGIIIGDARITVDSNYNLLWNNTTNYYGLSAGANDINIDPMFINATGNDFPLQPNSPAINAGADLSANGVITDILGIARPQGSGFDIGAYEYYEMPLSSLSSSGDTKDNVKPVLSFKKSSTMASGISSYSVSLDPGKNKSYSISGIPASGNGSSYYVWRDDTDTKVWFTNENDSDSSNDTINAYFKGLDSSELTEGKHTWSVTVTDSVENTSTNYFDLFIDKSAPTLTNLFVANVSAVLGGGVYYLPASQKTPSFMGKTTDPFQGSEKTNANGTKDVFDAVSSGIDKLTLSIKKSGNGGTYTTYLTKDYKDISGNFYITTPTPLTDGKYEVTLSISDKAGNKYSYPVFYLTTGSYQAALSLPFTITIPTLISANQGQDAPPIQTPTPVPSATPKPGVVIAITQTINIFLSAITSFFKNIFNLFNR